MFEPHFAPVHLVGQCARIAQSDPRKPKFHPEVVLLEPSRVQRSDHLDGLIDECWMAG
jgi:hypothetical protein